MPGPYELNVVLPALARVNAQQGAICAVHLAAYVTASERTLRKQLGRLERAGLVSRPYGPRNGWIVQKVLH